MIASATWTMPHCWRALSSTRPVKLNDSAAVTGRGYNCWSESFGKQATSRGNWFPKTYAHTEEKRWLQ